MSEDYGNIGDGFFLTPEEVQTLRNSKRELTTYGKQKLRKLMEQMEWEQIYNKISKSDDHILEKVNTYNLTMLIYDLIDQNNTLREKVEELQKDVYTLKDYMWNQ